MNVWYLVENEEIGVEMLSLDVIEQVLQGLFLLLVAL